MNNFAQSSLEYLLVLGVFFAMLVLFLPALEYASSKVFESNSIVLAKDISEKLGEECSLFNYFGEGTKKTISFTNSSEISFTSDGKVVKVTVGGKSYNFNCVSNKFSFSTESSIVIVMEKVNSLVNFSFD